MQNQVSLKSAERKVFQTTFADGLWDVFIGCFVLEFAIAPYLSASMGDFWSSAIFLPFWGIVYLAILLTRKYVVAPRLGTVSFGKARKRKLRKFSIVMIIVNTLVFLLGILAYVMYGDIFRSNLLNWSWMIPFLTGFFLLVGFSLAAYLLDFPRLFVYGLLLFAAFPVGEWLYATYGVPHHGYPVVFGVTSGVMILTGLVLFLLLLKNNPVINTPE